MKNGRLCLKIYSPLYLLYKISYINDSENCSNFVLKCRNSAHPSRSKLLRQERTTQQETIATQLKQAGEASRPHSQLYPQLHQCDIAFFTLRIQILSFLCKSIFEPQMAERFVNEREIIKAQSIYLSVGC